jgi:hypothetical protein
MKITRNEQRFNLLLLNDLEIYYEDYACSYFTSNGFIKGKY